MFINKIINCLLLINIIFGLKINNYKPSFINNKNNNLSKKDNLYNDLKKTSLLSKLIYEYNFVNDNNIKNNFTVIPDLNIPTNLTFDFIKRNNIYFNLVQFITFLDNRRFIKSTDKYFNLLNVFFPNTQIYGYFCNKNRLYALIIINRNLKEIIVAFRGSQYIDEWCKNLYTDEKELVFNNKFKIHEGIYNMYSENNADNNLIYILKNLYEYYPKYRKIFTGHSRGSINSILLSLELNTILNEKYDYEIFSFGSPPIFNKELGTYLHNHPKIKIYNIINNMDIVPLLPLYNKFHIGDEILLKDKNAIIKKHDNPYKFNNNISIKNIGISILQHDLNNYIDNIFNF